MSERPGVYVGPAPVDAVLDAVRAGGGEPASLDEADAVVWTGNDPRELPALRERVRWVQLPSAGVESWLEAGVVDGSRPFTSAAGAYARSVAEHALALVLAGARRLPEAARAHRWGAPPGAGLYGRTVAVVGAGGIGRELIALLAPLGVEILAVTRRGRPVEGAASSRPAERVGEVWPAADFVVLAAPATAATRHLVGREQLAAMRPGAWLVNIARGSLVDTDALVEALRAGGIGGAALDVTEPEPLPDGHPLWHEPRALITPHVANPPAAYDAEFQERVRENVARFAAGRELLGRIDPAAGY
jgi:phosphoglycerate dehydrogenase-like enzyme